MLIIVSGLPGTGKTTIGKALAAKRSATYIRVDEIEHTLVHNADTGCDIGPAGYLVAFAIASSNLKLGNLVIADSVNPVPESRQGWRDVAQKVGVTFLEAEMICSDEDEHRRRVETRAADIAGFELPSWAAVKAREYVPWTTDRLVVDTALLSASDAVDAIEARLNAIIRSSASEL
ncbi:AAA family ATPase [Chelativorans sp. M5D2P16]|uniref:AAA family ATPase n=1 Tax=Chelativorans sp. M5D2P16 TaxID=3095678 RepID=UPI002ACA06E9|nr:AAA family ATPase [Chelativorans sp. M5D2P16]MDZ5697067.1 AAA family ATPase [Chelativorans sp. M5D2P16]